MGIFAGIVPSVREIRVHRQPFASHCVPSPHQSDFSTPMQRATLGTFCGLTCLAMMVLSVSSSYVQVKFYYQSDAEGTGQSWNAYTPKDGSCSPCTNLVGFWDRWTLESRGDHLKVQ